MILGFDISHFFMTVSAYIKLFLRKFINPFSGEGASLKGDSFREKSKNLIVRELQANTTPLKGALALSLGVFMGIFPVHGLQVILLMILATILKLNRPLAFLGVNISCAPLLPFIAFIAVKIGSFVLKRPVLAEDMGAKELIVQYGSEFLVGSFILAPTGALLSFLLSFPLFYHLKRKGC